MSCPELWLGARGRGLMRCSMMDRLERLEAHVLDETVVEDEES